MFCWCARKARTVALKPTKRASAVAGRRGLDSCIMIVKAEPRPSLPLPGCYLPIGPLLVYRVVLLALGGSVLVHRVGCPALGG